MAMILLSDGRVESVRLRRELSLAHPCKLMPLHRLTSEDIRGANLIVSDMPLDNAVNVLVLKNVLGRYRNPDTPFLCVIPDSSYHSTCQANAIGATATLPANASREQLLQAVTALLPTAAGTTDLPATRIARSCAMQAGVSIGNIMDAAQSGSPIATDVLAQGTSHVLTAIGNVHIRDWLDIVWDYDDVTYQHCLLVAGLAASFAYQLGFHTDDRERLVKAAILHDIGKAKVPLAILNKPARLTDAELRIIRKHPVAGHELLVRQGGFDPEQLSVVRHHHEYLDGSGYPDGLAADEIIDLVRLTTICDIYAALIERRAYKAQLPPDAAFSTLQQMGPKLDRDLVAAFHKVMVACQIETHAARH